MLLALGGRNMYKISSFQQETKSPSRAMPKPSELHLCLLQFHKCAPVGPASLGPADLSDLTPTTYPSLSLPAPRTHQAQRCLRVFALVILFAGKSFCRSSHSCILLMLSLSLPAPQRGFFCSSRLKAGFAQPHRLL